MACKRLVTRFVDWLLKDTKLMAKFEDAEAAVESLVEGIQALVEGQTAIKESQEATDLKLDEVRALVVALGQSGVPQERIDALVAKIEEGKTSLAQASDALAESTAKSSAILEEAGVAATDPRNPTGPTGDDSEDEA